MLDRLEHSPELAKAIDQMTAVTRDFLGGDAIPRELVGFAVREVMRMLRAKRWASSQVLAYCRQLINAETARLGPATVTERRLWLDDQLAPWLLECEDGA